MNVFSFLKKYRFSLFVFLCGCQKPLSVSYLNQKKSLVPWSVSEDYRPPSFAEGPLQRVLTLHGNDVDQVYVDRQEEDDENWLQIGLTNEKGRFVDRDIEKNVRYRFGGKLITPWYESMKTILINEEISLPAKIKGFHCLVPEGVTLFIQDKTLELNCQYITILGNIYSFKKGAEEGKAGLNAGKLRLIGEEINLQGRVWLLGQDGGVGRLMKVGLHLRRLPGQVAGSGGEVYLQYKNIYEVYESFRLEGGRSGQSIRDIGANKSLSSNAQRGRVVRKRIST